MDGQQANGADFMVQSQTASPPGGGGGGGANGDAATVAAAAAAGNGAGGAAAANAATANGAINNNSEAKRAKLDTMKQNNPSRVIHIRNIPNDVTEAEIIHLGIPFGRVTNVLVLKGKNQVGPLCTSLQCRPDIWSTDLQNKNLPFKRLTLWLLYRTPEGNPFDLISDDHITRSLGYRGSVP